MKLRMIGLMVVVFLSGACSALSSGPVKQFTKGDELAFYDFTSPTTFEEGLYGNNTVRLQIASGVYNIQISTGDNTVYYGQGGTPQTDTLIEVTANQTTADLNTTYGVMCRMRGTVGESTKPNAEATAEATEPAADDVILAQPDATAEATAEQTAEATKQVLPSSTAEATAPLGATTLSSDNTSNNGDGYMFMVQGNGRYGILRSQGHKITPLVDWTSSSAVNQGAAQNKIKAICAGNYLALYVNDQFLADTTDSMYTKGQVGLVGASAGRSGMTVTFDNLGVYVAKPS